MGKPGREIDLSQLVIAPSMTYAGCYEKIKKRLEGRFVTIDEVEGGYVKYEQWLLERSSGPFRSSIGCDPRNFPGVEETKSSVLGYSSEYHQNAGKAVHLLCREKRTKQERNPFSMKDIRRANSDGSVLLPGMPYRANPFWIYKVFPALFSAEPSEWLSNDPSDDCEEEVAVSSSRRAEDKCLWEYGSDGTWLFVRIPEESRGLTPDEWMRRSRNPDEMVLNLSDTLWTMIAFALPHRAFLVKPGETIVTASTSRNGGRVALFHSESGKMSVGDYISDENSRLIIGRPISLTL